ncbi:MAG: hypothetical protein KatS3mg102_2288 [Planctomycetota bacterium]|nr:MAG: hypothetical protein KatS3mg102_2288 [Planctomycetota bacterium]
MMLRWVRKRDGRRAVFDVRKLAASLAAAAADAGETVLAEEIAEVVAIFCEKKFDGTIPTTAEIQDLVEKVLLDTNHPRTAAAFAERYRNKGRRLAEVTVRSGKGALPGPDGESLSEPAPEPWSEGRLVRTLVQRCGLAEEVAEEVAASVERRVLALGFKQIGAGLVRELLNAELAERGFAARLAAPELVSVRAEEVQRLLVAAYVRREIEAEAPPGGPEAAVGVDVLGRWALGHAYPPAVAAAHAEGTLHLQDVGRPLRVTSGAVALDWLKRRLGRGAPRSAAELMAAVATLLARAAPHHARAIGLPYANVFLAPFARGREAAVRRDLREALRLLAAAAAPGRPRVVLHLGPLPPELAEQPPVGVGARRWRTGYGELATEAERVAQVILELIGEVRSALGGRQLQVVLSVPAGAEFQATPAVALADALLVEAPGLRPQLTHGLVPAAALIGEPAATPFAGGALQVVALNCARAGYEAGPGDEPELRRRLAGALELALEAFAARQRLLETTLYRPQLPLWGGQPRGHDNPPPVVEGARGRHVVGLLGLEQALQAVTGERPAHNPAVAQLAGAIVVELASTARRLGAGRGLAIELEEPELTSAGRRLYDLDLQRVPAAVRQAAAGEEQGAEQYGSMFADPGADPAAVREVAWGLYRQLGLAPFLLGPERISRAAVFAAALAEGEAPR